MKIFRISQNLYKYLIYKRKAPSGNLISVLKDNSQLFVWAINDEDALNKALILYPNLKDLNKYGFILKLKKTKEIKPEDNSQFKIRNKPSHIPDLNNPKYYWEKDD